ncbi:MAG: Fur family transcriptional regulator [bacterium]|nr:Fur family transcriptional regulator [bacterium]
MGKKLSNLASHKDYRLTKQRLVILDWVRKTHSHPRAEDVYKGVRKKLSKISLATVYRNLSFLSGHGLLKEFIIDKVAHFESRVDSHVHFVCEECHGIEDIEDAKDVGMIRELQAVAKKNKFYIRSENYEIRGICKRCKNVSNPRKLIPELFCIACGHLTDDLKKEEPVCLDCKFQLECNYQK